MELNDVFKNYYTEISLDINNQIELPFAVEQF